MLFPNELDSFKETSRASDALLLISHLLEIGYIVKLAAREIGKCSSF